MGTWKFKALCFLISYPYGLLGKIYRVESGESTYNIWDRLRCLILTGRGGL